MDLVQVVLVVFGAIVFAALGSFVGVVIDRLPRELDEPNQYNELWDTNSWPAVVGGHSRCSSCAVPVRAYENIPIISWIFLRGRCRTCGSSIPGYLPLVEIASPVLFLFTIWAHGLQWRILPLLWSIPVALAIAVIDIRTFMVPTRLVWPAFISSAAIITIVSGVEGQWVWIRSALLGVAVLAGPLFVLWFSFPKGMGFGDVRLATLVGLLVGFYSGESWLAPISLAVIALALSSLLGLVLGFAAIGARGRKAKVPFGPPLLAAGYVCSLYASEILSPFGF